jgi:hypothetical protein
MGIKDDLEKDMRTIKASGLVLSKEDMIIYRVLKIRNIVCSEEDYKKMNIEFLVSELCENMYNVSSVENIKSTLEFINGEPMRIVSIVIFADIYSFQMFAMTHGDLYMSDKELMLQLLN